MNCGGIWMETAELQIITKSGSPERITVGVRRELASIFIYGSRNRGHEPSEKEVAKRYLLTEKMAQELLRLTPRAAEPFPGRKIKR
jgi:hypothetical protein